MARNLSDIFMYVHVLYTFFVFELSTKKACFRIDMILQDPSASSFVNLPFLSLHATILCSADRISHLATLALVISSGGFNTLVSRVKIHHAVVMASTGGLGLHRFRCIRWCQTISRKNTGVFIGSNGEWRLADAAEAETSSVR